MAFPISMIIALKNNLLMSEKHSHVVAPKH